MPMVNLIGASNAHRSPTVSSSMSLNLYPEIVDGGDAKAPVVLIGRPGTPVWADFTNYVPWEGFPPASGKVRGSHWAANVLYLALGSVIYKVVVNSITGEKTLEPKLIISDGNTPVNFADDGFHMLVVDGSSMWSIGLTYGSAIEVISTDAFSFPVNVLYAYTRFVCINADPTVDGSDATAPIIANQNKFFWSDVGVDGYKTWEGANFEACSLNSDPIISCALRQGELYLLGPASYEVFAFTGDYDTPFKRVGGSAANIGCLAAGAVATIADQILWVGSASSGKNQVFITGTGYDAVRISTHAIEFALDEANSKGVSSADMIAFTYQQEGHVFYVMTSRNLNRTFVYDMTTQMWHERSTRRITDNKDGYWFPMYAVYAYGEVLVADDSSAKLMRLDLNVHSDYATQDANGNWIGTTPIVCRRRMATTWSELRPFRMREFMVDMQVGVGTAYGQGSNPQATLRVSCDGGRTWSNARSEPIGKMGEYRKRVRWRGLGMSTQAVFEVTISDPVKVVMVAANLYYDVSTNR